MTAVEGTVRKPGDDVVADSAELTHSQAIARSSSVLLVRRFVILVATAVSTLVVVRVLAPADYGRLQSALALWAVLVTAADFGFGTVASREMARRPDEARGLFRACVTLQSGIALLTALLMVAVGLVVGGGAGLLYVVLAPSLLVCGLAAGRSWFMARHDVGALARIDVLVNGGLLAATVFIAVAHPSALLLAACTSVTTIVNTAWVGLAARRRLRVLSPARVDRRGLLAAVLPVGVMSILSRVYLSIDLVLMGLWVPGTDVGYYAGAVKIVNLLNTFPGVLVGAAIPGIARAADDPGDLRRLLERLMHWFLTLMLPVFVFATVFAPAITLLALGDEYRPAVAITGILLVSGMVATLSQLLGAVLVGASLVRPLLVQNVAAVCLNVAGNWILVPRYGVTAAAWLTVATEMFVCFGAWWLVRRGLGVRPGLGHLVRPAIALAAAAAAGYALSGHVLLGMTAFACTYAVLVVLLRCWPEEFVPAAVRRRRSCVS